MSVQKSLAPDSLRPLATAAPDELTRDEGMLRGQLALPESRTMLYAIPSGAPRSPEAGEDARGAARRRMRLGLVALCALLAGVALVLLWGPAPSAPRGPRLAPLSAP